MNARTKDAPPQTHSAQALADMPLTAGREALKAQECAFMQSKHGKAMLDAVNAEADEFIENSLCYGRISCIDLQDRIFTWEAVAECEICGDVGQLFSAAGEPRECTGCKDNAADLFYSDYDGNRVEAPA